MVSFVRQIYRFDLTRFKSVLMHLMSFYANPYSSKQRDAMLAGRINFIRGGWFAAGLLLGLGVMYGVGQMWDDEASYSAPTVAASPEPVQEAVSDTQPVTGEILLSEATPPVDASAEQDTVSQVPPVEETTKTVNVTIASGDTLIEVLQGQGIRHIAAHRLAKQVNRTFNLKRLRPGHQMTLVLENEASGDTQQPEISLMEMKIFVSKLETVVVKRQQNGTYKVSKTKKKLVQDQARVSAPIDSSLYVAAAGRGVPDAVIAKMIKNFSYDIDFQRDIRAGDSLDVLYERKKTEEGELVGSGDVIYAKLHSRGRVYKHYRYVNDLGFAEYYDENGKSIVRKFLRTPIDGARLSSRYGMRKHPILGYNKMHAGVDFAAPTGTPIFAAGDGVVQFAGRQGGYGNIVIIKHNGTYSTAYAHAHRFAKGIRKGRKVSQGQTIAYVGSTGRSTGPHLHYEIRKNGKKINPLNVKFTGGKKLTGKKLAEFKKSVRKIETRLASMQPVDDAPDFVTLAQNRDE